MDLAPSPHQSDHDVCPPVPHTVLKPTAMPSLPGVVVSVLALHSIAVSVFALDTKCCRVLYNSSLNN